MTKPKPVKGWVVVKDLTLYYSWDTPHIAEIFKTRKDAIKNAELMEWDNWDNMIKQGYRAVRATLKVDD